MKRKEGGVFYQVPMYDNGQAPSATTSDKVCLTFLTADGNSKPIHILIYCHLTRCFIIDFQEVLGHPLHWKNICLNS